MIILLFETSSILKTRIATIALYIIIYKIVNFLWVIYYFLCGIELGSNDYEIKKDIPSDPLRPKFEKIL